MTEQALPALNKRSYGLRYGLISGLVLVIFTAVLYKCGVKVYLGGISWLGILWLLTMATLAPIAEKRANGGWLSFQEALKTSLSVILLSFTAQTIFNWLLMNVFDHAFRQLVIEESLKTTEAMFRYMHYDEEKIAHDMAIARATDPYTVSNQCVGLAQYCIVGFIFALIIAAIVKRKNPALERDQP